MTWCNIQFLWRSCLIHMWQYTAGWPPLYQHPKPLMGIRSSSGFFYLRPGVFHISLRTHKTQHTQPRGWKKRTNNRGLGLAPSAKRSLLHFPNILCICRLSQPCIRAKFPQSHQERWLILSRWLTWALDPQVLAAGFPRLLWLLSPAGCPGLPIGFFCSALGPSFPRSLPVSWEISRTNH